MQILTIICLCIASASKKILTEKNLFRRKRWNSQLSLVNDDLPLDLIEWNDLEFERVKNLMFE